MRHKKIYGVALKLDRFIKEKGNERLPSKKILLSELRKYYATTEYLGSGRFKRVFHIKATERDLALKVGHPEDIEKDWKVYRHAKDEKLANRYYAKCYWHTKYCSLQKFGKKREVPYKISKDLKKRANNAGLRDIGTSSDNRNIRYFDGHFKIIDAGFIRKITSDA
ncbi:Uncharacterised protein [uncultured archaeon]|nr:Uncharacterised protein [uncultured archaeon]